MHPESVSLVVPAWRDNPEFIRCLDSLSILSPQPGEVIVAVDGVDQRVADQAHARGFKVVMLPDAPGVAAARNAGASAVRGELLLFTDSDIELPPSFVAYALAIFKREPGLAAAIGSYDDQPAAAGVVSRYRNLLHHFTHQQGRTDAQTFWGGCGAVRREIFNALGGFDASYRKPSVEDIEFGYRLRRAGHHIRLEPAWQVKHLKRWTLRSMVVTDLTCRAIPWTRLLLRERRLDNDLNLDSSSRLSGLCAVTVPVALLAALISPWFGFVALLALAGMVFLHRKFFARLVKLGGWVFAVACVPLHMTYLITAVAGFAWATLTHTARINCGKKAVTD